MKRIETPETLPGGRIVLTLATREDLTAQQMEIIQVGAPAACGDADCERNHGAHPRSHPIDAKVGDWVLVAPRSLSDSGEDGYFVVNQDDVLAVLSQV